MTRGTGLFVVLVGILAAFAVGCGSGARIGTIDEVQGEVSLRVGSAKDFAPAVKASAIADGDAMRTGKNGFAVVSLDDLAVIKIKPVTYFEFHAGDPRVSQKSGRALYQVRPQSGTFRIDTPVGTTAVLGTILALTVSEKGAAVFVKEGQVEFTPTGAGTPVKLGPGEKLTMGDSGKLPTVATFSLDTWDEVMDAQADVHFQHY